MQPFVGMGTMDLSRPGVCASGLSVYCSHIIMRNGSDKFR